LIFCEWFQTGFFSVNARKRVNFFSTLIKSKLTMLGSKAVQALRQFSTTAVRRGHAYEGPGHVSKKKNVTCTVLGLSLAFWTVLIFLNIFTYNITFLLFLFAL